MEFRTDRNNNPAAFTTGIAQQAGLVSGVDYEPGDPFTVVDGVRFFTAKLLGDPVATTIRVINAIGYYTKSGSPRWIYIAIPQFIWLSLTPDQKRQVIGFHYQHEGGEAMKHLFA